MPTVCCSYINSVGGELYELTFSQFAMAGGVVQIADGDSRRCSVYIYNVPAKVLYFLDTQDVSASKAFSKVDQASAEQFSWDKIGPFVQRPLYATNEGFGGTINITTTRCVGTRYI